jgi:hypothetical protein
MLVTSASEIALGENAGITVAPAAAPASAVGVRTCARNAAAPLEAVTGTQVCELPATVVQTEPPLTYVKRFGTAGLAAVPNPLWHPPQVNANEAGGDGAAPLGVQGPDDKPIPAPPEPAPALAAAPEGPVPLTTPELDPLVGCPWSPTPPDVPECVVPEPQPAAKSAVAKNAGPPVARRRVRAAADRTGTAVGQGARRIKQFATTKPRVSHTLRDSRALPGQKRQGRHEESVGSSPPEALASVAVLAVISPHQPSSAAARSPSSTHDPSHE